MTFSWVDAWDWTKRGVPQMSSPYIRLSNIITRVKIRLMSYDENMNEFSCKSADMDEKNSFNAILIDWFMWFWAREKMSAKNSYCNKRERVSDRDENRRIKREKEWAMRRRWQSLLAFLHAHSCVCWATCLHQAATSDYQSQTGKVTESSESERARDQ